MGELDITRDPIPAGTVIRTRSRGRVRVVTGLPAAPAGKRRCWWCCTGRLIADDDELEAVHRYGNHPSIADPGRFAREREADLEETVRAEAAWKTETAGSVTAGNLRRLF